MSGARLAGAVRRLYPEHGGRVAFRAEDSGGILTIRGFVALTPLPDEGEELVLEEVRPAGEAGRAIVSLRLGGLDGAAEAEGWWLHEPLPHFYAALGQRFGPGAGGRRLVRGLVALLGLPGMRGWLTRWHARRARLPEPAP
jgi:hypothetical protein